ncbi:MAG: LysR family transcriptional regulator [Bdellovibrionales bacterium]|nr:LysR family transcriptional regulator [Bdellovibrionales bacterium]
MNYWINYHHLNYFRVIASEGSISRAAEKLKIGQPTLSAQLKQFEDTIGVQLFERKHKKLILTESGNLALEYANEIFKMGGELLEVLHDRFVPNRPHVQFGALDSVPKYIVLSIAKAALRTGRCTVSLLEGSGDDLIREMILHKIDLVIANYIPNYKNDIKIYSRSISKSPIYLFGSKKYKGLKKNFPASLHEASFILPTFHSKLRQDVNHFLQANNVTADIVAETQDTALQKLMAIDDLGLIPLTREAASTYVEDKKLYEIGKVDGVYEEIFLLSASRKIENPISSMIMKHYK